MGEQNLVGEVATAEKKISKFFKKKKQPTDYASAIKDIYEKGIIEDITTKETGSSLRKLNKRTQGNPEKQNATKKYEKLTILDEQVQRLKLQHSDKLLMVQVGYKYKFFAEDAVKAASVLNFMLIEGKLNIKNDNPEDWKHRNFAYCSLPEQRAKLHLKKLLHFGYKIGVVKQFLVEGSTNRFERRLTHVYTRATYAMMNEDFEEEDNEQFSDENGGILSIDISSDQDTCIFSFLCLELNTGNLLYDSFRQSKESFNFLIFETKLNHFGPSEVCLTPDSYDLLKNIIFASNRNIKVYTVENISDQKQELIQTPNLSCCFNLLYAHLQTYGLNSALEASLCRIKHAEDRDTFQLSSHVLKTMNFFDNQVNSQKSKTIWGLLNNDNIFTTYGKSLLKNWIKNPLMNIEKIELRSKAITFLQNRERYNNLFLTNIDTFLNDFKNKNLLRTCNRLKMNVTQPINRKELYYYLESIAKLRKIFARHNEYLLNEVIDPNGELSKRSSALSDIFIEIHTLLTEKVSIDFTIKMIKHQSIFEKDPEKQIKTFFDLNFYDNSNTIKNKMIAYDIIIEDIFNCLEVIKAEIGKPYLKFKDESDFFVEVNRNYCKNVPPDWVVNSKTNVVVRYEIPLIREKLEGLKLAHLDLLKTCQEEYLKFIKKLNQDYSEVIKIINLLGTYDCFQCLAKSTKQFYCKPQFTEKKGIVELKSSFNPMSFLETTGSRHLSIENDISLDSNNIFILTGPNAGGKTSLIKQVAYLVILAQLGCNTPCKTHLQSIFTSIFIRSGESDSIISKKSTFQIEMEECYQILSQADSQSLVLMDEIGKGTSNLDGMAITFAILKYLILEGDANGIVMFITHYHNIVEQLGFENVYKMDFSKVITEKDIIDIVFNFKLKKGASGVSLGLNVAQQAGLPEDVICDIIQIRQHVQDSNFLNEFYLCLINKDITLLKKLLSKI